MQLKAPAIVNFPPSRLLQVESISFVSTIMYEICEYTYVPQSRQVARFNLKKIKLLKVQINSRFHFFSHPEK